MPRLTALLVALAAAAGCATPKPALPTSGVVSELHVFGKVPLPSTSDSATFEVLVPAPSSPVRATVVFLNRDLEQYAFDDRDWRAMCARAGCAMLRLTIPRQDRLAPTEQFVRNAAQGGATALLNALASAATLTGHSELRDAGLVLFGFSAAGNFGPTFAALHPDRTIGFIHYHSHLRGIPLDSATLRAIPALSLSGATDDIAGTDDARALWRGMRQREALWAHVVHARQPHYSIDGLVQAGHVMREWTEAVIAARTVSGSRELRPMHADSGWFVSEAMDVADAVARFRGDRASASWVPNESVALGMRLLAGMCETIGTPRATDLLGPATQPEYVDSSACKFKEPNLKRELWVNAYRASSNAVAVQQLRQMMPPNAGRPIDVSGLPGHFHANAEKSCSSLGVPRLVWTYMIIACGPGFGKDADSTQLLPIAKRIVGLP